jgi:hypothetical protein
MSSHNDSFVASGSSPTHAAQRVQASPDFLLEKYSSIYLLRPLTENARAWVEDHIGSDNGFQPYWPAVVIEYRYVAAILEGISSDGLVVSR